MKHVGLAAALAGGILCASVPGAHAENRTEAVSLKSSGHDARTLKGSPRGYDGAAYTFAAPAGRLLHVLFSPKNRFCFFNVLAPGRDEALFNGSIKGNEFGGRLPAAGTYTVQVYLMRNAARRNETCRYSLSLEMND